MTGEAPLEALFSTPGLSPCPQSGKERLSESSHCLSLFPPESWGSAETSATTFPRASWSFLPSGNFHPWLPLPTLSPRLECSFDFCLHWKFLLPYSSRIVIGEFLSSLIPSFLSFILSSSFSFPLPSFLPVIHWFYSCILSIHSFSFHQALGRREGRTDSEVKEYINLCERRKVNKQDRLHNGQVPVQSKHVRPFVKKLNQNFKAATAEH